MKRLLLTLFFCLPLLGNSAEISLVLENPSLKELTSEIESQCEFKFAYGNEIEIETKISGVYTFQNEDLNIILQVLTDRTPFMFRVLGNNIAIAKDKLVNGPIDVKEQNTVRGKVIDADSGIPVPSANVIEKGTSNGVMTDFDGEFTINVPEGAVLEVSFLGYATTEIQVDGQTYVEITLQPETSALDEVIVVGYGTQKKKDLTGAISSLQTEDFAPGTNSNAVQLLSGTAAGVNVSQVSSAPGAALKIQIRGSGSINSDNSVLFVVDGLPGVNPSSLSPGDIESIQVLKDASAAAIYGTRAANGVVLITTKKGKAGITTLSYDSYVGIQEPVKLLDVLDSSNYMQLVNSRTENPVYSDEEIASAGIGTNWQDELFRDAIVQNHQISMTGGNEKGNYYLGLNYFDQEGIVKNSSNKKYNARLNMQTRPLENLLVTANVNFTRQNTRAILFSNLANENAGPLNSAIQFDPTLPAGLDENGNYYRNQAIGLDNPVALNEGITDLNLSNNFYGSITTDYEVVENLTATLRLGADVINGRSDFYRSRITEMGRSNGGLGTVNASESTHWVAEYLLKYENTFNYIHNFSFTGGATFEEFLTRGLGGSSAGFLSDVTFTNLLQSGDGDLRDNVSSSKFKNQLNGYIGRLTYGFDNRYLVTASFRVDGSSRFSTENQYAFFPSGSIGWRINEEQFMKNTGWINELKLRLGYGQLGNQGINNFETRQTLVAGGNPVFGGSVKQGVVLARLANPDLKWETTAEVNVGVDYSFFNNRISGSLDYFNRTTKDQLMVKPLPSSIGFTSVRSNLGKVTNKGVDFGLNTKNIEGLFNWNSSLTLSFLKNEVTELPDFTEEIIGGSIGTFINQYNIVREGSPLYSFYGYEINGIFQEGDDIENSPTPNVSGYAAGMPRFVDQNGDGVIDSDDRVVLGDPFPDFSFGFNNSFRYKNISLDIFITGVQGIETLDGNVTEALYPTNFARNSISKYYKERWTPENPTNILPSGENHNLYGGARAINSLTVVDASFVRLKNISLGYDVPVPEKYLLSTLQIYLAADNLFTITDFEGFDPDASASGTGISRSSYNSYPLAKTIRLGLNVQF